MQKVYKTQGVCARNISIDVENGTIKEIEFLGGCDGNLKGIAMLCKGQDVKYVAEILKDIKCGAKETSCPAQLSKALEELL